MSGHDKPSDSDGEMCEDPQCVLDHALDTPCSHRGAPAMSGRPQCIIEVGHRTLSADASWLMNGDPERPICDRHKGQYETAYDDYSHIEWVPIDGPVNEAGVALGAAWEDHFIRVEEAAETDAEPQP